MQNIGLMMTYNEGDILPEVMDANAKYFDKILVLDGSTDNSEEILRSYDCVKYLIKDQDLYPKRRIADGARQFLLEKSQEMYGYEGWFTLLHGDEIMVDNPNEIALKAENVKAERVNWHGLNFFLHTSQKDSYDPNLKIQEHVIYYQPGALEIRQFKNKKGIFYNLNQVYNVLPSGIGLKTLLDYPIFKHYVHRSVKQKQLKPVNGLQVVRGDNNEALKVSYDSIFRDKGDNNLKQVRKYAGSFHELEPGNRPSFFKQWMAWRKYRTIEWGVVGPIVPSFVKKLF